jgi:DNA-binding NarL/FixJ family response regulator
VVLAQAEQLRPTDQGNGARRPWPIAAPPVWAAALSRRDIAVLCLLAEGESTADIAEALAYSESTIKNVIHDLVRHLGARNRAQAVAMAIRGGVI